MNAALDPKKPLVVLNKNDKGAYTATIYGGIANWARISDPEPILDANKVPVVGKDGKPKQKWSCSLYIPKETEGVKELQAACIEIRKNELKGAGKIAALKDGDREIQRLVEEQGKNPEKLESMKGMWIISASTTIPPVIHNEVYSGCIAVMVIQLASYDIETKGIKAYLQEIGRVAAGTRIGGGPRAAVLTSVAFETDDTPASTGASSAPARDDSNPWE